MESISIGKIQTTGMGVALSGIVFMIVFISTSFIINAVLYGDAHNEVTFFRSEDQFIASPIGLAITAFIWSLLVSLSYALFGTRLSFRHPFNRGLVYGTLVFLFFIWQQELFFYQFVDFEIGILIGAISHMALAFTLGCALIAVIQSRFTRDSSTQTAGMCF